ncbi:MAG: bifunctional adenosylcobinamide kinase/adenosylcobinamide-phosphate guanylyltransferase [Qingshengfaniella sp.]
MPPTALPSLSLILGGAASGKSAFAEGLVLGSGLDPVYVATSQALDAEMRNKIFRHQTLRGDRWQTVEAPFDLSPAIAGARHGQALLIDCLTMWLTNHLLAEHDLPARIQDLLADLDRARVPVVLVSNEVGHGIVPENALARRFREAQGRLNQAIAAQADLAVAVMAGLPLVLKGTLPEAAA